MSSGCFSLSDSDDKDNSNGDHPLRVDMSWDAYFHPDEIGGILGNLSLALPEKTAVFSIGSSHEGRTIWALRIGGPEDRDMEIQEDIEMLYPRILIVGVHHGQEWMAAMPPLHFAWTLVNEYGYNETITQLVGTREITIIPILNMDGMAWDMDHGAADWRKNRQPNPDGSIGTDLNRNYPYHWGEAGMNTPIPSTAFYQGPPDLDDNDGDLLIDEDKVDGIDNDLDGDVDEDRNGGFSAPETMALGDLVTQSPPIISLSFHTAGAQILYPWSYSYGSTPDDALFQAMAGKMAEITGYDPMQGSDLYPSAGEWSDWMYGVHGTLAFTIELLDQSGGDEYAPPEMIQPTVDLVLPLQLAVTDWAADPSQVM